MRGIDSKHIDKFNGNLGTTSSSNECELDKESSVEHLSKKVRLYGQQTFYTLTYQQQVPNLFKYYHKFSVEEVIDQYELRCNEPEPEIVLDTAQESEMSIQLYFELCNYYEFDDIGLYRLVVESIISPALMEQIATEYENDENYESYPGQILLMMALDMSNASVQRDTIDMQLWYNNLTLDSFTRN